MVFESLVVDLINRYLGSYVEALNASQLQLGLLGGNARLENLDIKANAFDGFNLPVKVVQGHIAKKEEQKSDSFGEKLAAQIVKNLQIDIRNIHVRYEDGYSIPGRLFSLGVTLSALTFQTTDPEKRPLLIRDESIREFYKAVMRKTIASPENLQTGFTYILRPVSSSAMLHLHTRPEETEFTVPQMDLVVDLAEIEFSLSLLQYRDITSFLNATDRMITQSKYRKYRPSSSLHGHPREWWHYAYTSVLEESIRRRRRMWSWEHIREHRRITREYIVLWTKHLREERFTTEQQKRVEECEDFLDVFNIVLCRQQAELQHNLTKSKQAVKKSSGGIFRWFSRAPSDTESSTTSSSSTNSDSTETDADRIVKQLRQEMTKEEKARLYSAINYSEGGGTGKFPPTYESSVIALTLRRLGFTLVDEGLSDSRILTLAVNTLTANVIQRAGDNAMSLKLRLDSLEALGARPSLDHASLARSNEIPSLITSRAAYRTDVGGERLEPSGDHLLVVYFEKNPLDRKADSRVRVQADPLQLVYDSETVNKIVHFLAPPEDIRLDELSSSVLSSLEDVKESTISGLRHLASRRAYMDVRVDVRPSYFILPDAGVFRENCRLLLVDLGSLTVRSTQPKVHAEARMIRALDETEETVGLNAIAAAPSHGSHGHKKLDATFDQLKEGAYDKFEICLSSVQVLMVEEDQDWRVLRTKDQSPNHILRPLGMNFSLARCLLRNDVNLPSILVDGCLPVFSVDLTDRVLKSLFELVSNVPFPESDKKLTTPADRDEVLKDAQVISRALPLERAVATRDVLLATRQLKRQGSESTINSWFSDTMDEFDENQELDDEDYPEDQQMDELSAPDEGGSLTRSSTVDSGMGQDQLHLRANKITRKLQRESAMRLRRSANLVDLKVDFVIRMIQIQLLQRAQTDTAVDSIMLSISVHEVGMNALKRRWDQEVHAHIGTLSVTVPSCSDRRTGEPVCLAKTRRHIEGHHLLAVHLLVAEKSAPDFQTRYKNTRHHMLLEFKSLEFCVHQESVLLLIDYANNLLHSLTLSQNKGDKHVLSQSTTTVTSPLEWAEKVGDKEAASVTIERIESETRNSKNLPENLTAIDAIESRMARQAERRAIRLDAAAEAARSGKTVIIRELNITQWLVSATLDDVKMHVCSNATDVLSTAIQDLRLDVRTTYNTVEVSAVLSKLELIDRIESTLYRKIVWVDPEESMASLQLTYFLQGTDLPENRYNPDKVDVALNLQIGKIHAIFLYNFVMRTVNFMNVFQVATDAVMNKVQEISTAAVQQVQDVVSNPTEFRLGLNVDVQAPVIYMPQHSFSGKALVVDLGRVTYLNHFEFFVPGSIPVDCSSVVPSPGLMIEHAAIELSDLRLSRAVLSDETLKAEKGIIEPINISLRMLRNLNPSLYPEAPTISVKGGVKSIHICACQGDYRVAQEVMLDNLAEIPSITSPEKVKSKPSAENKPSVLERKSNLSKPGSPHVRKAIVINATPETRPPVVLAVRFSLEVGSLNLDLFSGEQPVSEWKDAVPEQFHLANCTLSGFTVSGRIGVDSSSEIITKLHDIQLTDTRPDAKKQITRVLDHKESDVAKHDELIYVEFKQDANQKQKVLVALRGIHLCASMDYLLALADFHLKSAPQFEKKVALAPITASGKRKRIAEPPNQTPLPREPPPPPDKFPNDIEVQVLVGDPELVLVEDIYDLESNSLKVTASVHMQYSVREAFAITDACIKGITVMACPYNEKLSGKNSKEILSPTELSYYCKQPINGSMQASVHLDTVLVNINPGTIQLLARIINSLTSSASLHSDEDSAVTKTTDSKDSNVTVKSFADKNFWSPVPIDQLEMPYLDSATAGSNEPADETSVSQGCDVSKVLEKMDERSKAKIVVRLQTLRVILESQVGTKSLPMLVLESSLDGEIISPSTSMEIKLSLDLSLSYYNDVLNQWEQILETIREEDDRMWSVQFEMITTNMDELLAEEDMDEVGCLQASTNTILLVSRDNLELTVSKSALEMLNNLGRSFEAAYKQEFLGSSYDLGGQAAAPYRIQNRTGWPIRIRLEDTSLQLTDYRRTLSSVFISPPSGPKPESDEARLMGRTSTRISQPSDRISESGLSYLLKSGEEFGFTEPQRATQKTLTLRSLADKARHHMVRVSWPPDSTMPKPIGQPELSLALYSSGNILLRMPKIEPTAGATNKEILYPVIAQITPFLGTRVITLRSTVQVVNETSERLCVYSRLAPDSVNNRPALLAKLESNEVYVLPVDIVNSSTYTGIYIGPETGSMVRSTHPAYWPQAACAQELSSVWHSHDRTYLTPLAEQRDSSSTALLPLSDLDAEGKRCNTAKKPIFNWPAQLMQCRSDNSPTTYFYNVVTMSTCDPLLNSAIAKIPGTENLSSASFRTVTCWNDFMMIVRDSIVLHNQLPIPINFVVPENSVEVAAGGHCTLRTVRPSKATIEIWFSYEDRIYRGKVVLSPTIEELSVVTFESREGYELLCLYLGLRCITAVGQMTLTIYVPYWMINKTGKDLTYKSSDDTEVIHPASFDGALLYSSLAKSVFGKRKATLRVDDSAWSDKFSLDTVGSSGRVNCKGKQKTFEIGVKIDLSSSGLTKIVTLMPYFMIVNKSPIDLECNESLSDMISSQRETTVTWSPQWISVPAGEAVPFWPQATSSKAMLLRCRAEKNLVTEAFPFYESHSILMKLAGKYPGIFVEVQTTEEATVITLQLYQEGMALVRLINHLGDRQSIFYHQRGVNETHELSAGLSILYAWDCSFSERELVFYCNKDDRPRATRLTIDFVEEFYVNDTKAYWVSFMWNMQRVLLFTQDVNAAKNARLSADLERIDQEIIISIQSIGLSLVDNAKRSEVAYLSVTSSGICWSQVKRGNRLKPLRANVSESLENAYTTYANHLQAGEPVSGLQKLTDLDRPVEVDFSQMMMFHPDRCELRRAFEPGVFIRYKNSPSQMQVHAKIFRVQLDNQVMDCTFPVVLAPYPQPKSVALDTGPKPLVELSAIVARTLDPGAFRFKYFRVLIQEMQLKLDQGFLSNIFDFFSGSVAHVPEEEAFKADVKLINDRLIDSPVLLAHLQDGNRSVFDNLHISPIKMHVSFSLTGSSQDKSSALPSEVLNLFLQSLGVVLTDVQDVIFKLAYFERQACIMTVDQMISEMTRHYVGQGVRQMYVLVLGLDVLGNPFGVLRGVAQGVEDLFYEPVKGAVLGPEEFAEGVALGVKSLFGHAVGGAAGAVSRITGTIGKGVAALTLDEDYKRLRREQMARRPETLSAGLAQGGRGLVLGVYHGVTGVVMKPVEGARKDGVEGFFKGVGKGLVGALTRPVSGVVDFASSSFEGIRRFADTVSEVGRVRPPRFIRVDGVIRPYDRREAEGHLILKRLDKDGTYGHYLYHVLAFRGSSVLVLTSTHLLVAECVDLLGTCSCSWQTPLSGLAEIPVVNRAGILITLRERQKKIFTTGQQTKQFDCDYNAAVAMVREIDRAMSKTTDSAAHTQSERDEPLAIAP
ncbi:unnamed protein product [Calicophoron daubneyi]|uniref:Uncharacterized protein n=1 Tax=Calicophoron daubneyi TaxID=300641 RepID=A0AAV2TNU4_CALDB